MERYQLGLYEKALPAFLNWEEKLAAAKEAGFDFLELSMDETDEKLSRLDWDAGQRLSLVRMGAEVGLPLRTMCLSGHRKYPLGSHDAATRQRGLDIMEKALQLACDLGIRIIQLAGYDVYYEEGDAETRALFRENLEKAVHLAARYGVVMGFETMETPFMDTVSKGMAYVDDLRSPYLGMYPDLGNLTNGARLYGLSVAGEIRAGQGHTFAMHLKETETGVYRNMRFGTGQVDFQEGIRESLGIGVRLFVAECWHDGGDDWRKVLAFTNQFLRERFA